MSTRSMNENLVPTEPTVAVIIPTRNRGHLIEAAVNSVLDQSVAPSELLVVDQGSTDDTSEKLNALGVRVIQDNQRGAGAARNKGLLLTHAPLVLFLDSDDVLMREAVSLLRSGLLSEGSDFCFGRTRNVNTAASVNNVTNADHAAPLASATLFHRNVFLRFGPFDDDNHSFPRLIIQARQQGVRESQVDAVVCHRLIHEGNLSRDVGNTRSVFELARYHRALRGQEKPS